MTKNKLAKPTPDTVLHWVISKGWTIDLAYKYIDFAIMEDYEGDWREAREILDAANEKTKQMR